MNWKKIKEKPILIAGPCSAETHDQVIETAQEIAKIEGIRIFRSGIWKPRTRPGAFEGIGAIGLKWLQEVKELTNLLVSVEVAIPEHVDECLKHGIDILWVGARTTTSPFAIQELANALRGTNTPVFIKNPMNPDISLWVGAAERFLNNNIENIGVIHRGFSIYKNKYRNQPQWDIPIEMKRRLPDIPMICDPSHITGNIDYIPFIAQMALNLDFDGLMIESHINPETALSDNDQQLTPCQLYDLISDLKFKKSEIKDELVLEKIEELRSEIDHIDIELLDIFEKRMNIAKEIGLHKDKKNITIFQKDRWDKVFNNAINRGSKRNLSKEFMIKIFKAIHQESIKNQTT